MASWSDGSPRESRTTVFDVLAIIVGIPTIFFGLYFGLDALLQLIAGLFV